jgi:hypothetical protein
MQARRTNPRHSRTLTLRHGRSDQRYDDPLGPGPAEDGGRDQHSRRAINVTYVILRTLSGPLARGPAGNARGAIIDRAEERRRRGTRSVEERYPLTVR